MNSTITADCVLDRAVVNDATIGNMTDLGLTFLANLCGRNRGAFVLPSDNGHTYGCTAFPPNFAELAGVETDVPLPDANALVETWQQHNVTAADTVNLLDYFNQVVYSSTGVGVADDPYACNTAGLATLQCHTSVATLDTPIRAVTTAGLFVDAPFVGKSKLSATERQAFYTAQDFVDMAALGLNTVQIPFPLEAFVEDDGLVAELTTVLDWVQEAQLRAIVALDGTTPDEAIAITAAAEFCADHVDVILGMTVPSLEAVATARTVSQNLKLFLYVRHQGKIQDLVVNHEDPNLFGALDLSHTGGVANVASSSSQDDRSKLFYHESVACTTRSPLDYTACYKQTPLWVASGFDLAIDDCVNQGTSSFRDYGQCDRFNETIGSAWWKAHRQSFAARQLFAYEQGGLGWSFAAWKLYGDDDTSLGQIDSFAKLLSFRDVAAAGLMPSLLSNQVAEFACLNPPKTDFVMGDTTYAPTAAPVDCGDGWWNETIQDCTYWIPPVTDAPTACPTTVCDDESLSYTLSNMMVSTGVGALVGLLIGLVVGSKVLGRGRPGYQEIPSHYNQ